MKINVNVYSSLREYLDPRPPLGEPIVMDLESGTEVRDIVTKLGIPVDEIAIIMINHNHKSLDYQISEDDNRIGLFPLSGGG